MPQKDDLAHYREHCDEQGQLEDSDDELSIDAFTSDLRDRYQRDGCDHSQNQVNQVDQLD